MRRLGSTASMRRSCTVRCSGFPPREGSRMSNETTLRLKLHYSVVPHSSDVVELRHGTWNAISFTLSDEGGAGRLARIVNRLDGRLSAAQIAAAEAVPASDVEALVDELT